MPRSTQVQSHKRWFAAGLALLLAATATASAQDAPAGPQNPVGAALDESIALLRGPTMPPAPAPAELQALSCEELYLQRVALLRQGLDYVPPYWNDPRNISAVTLGTMATPFYYYLGYTALQGYRDLRRHPALDAELHALRQASAAQDCFVVE